ncbi:hypothetical protein PRUPE_7G044400 [Prunus persica]|uniref:Uncharacterized protein n=1 Tax=Prunus persica TaxID=3760 RepID=A0A251N8S0_PRUPE|nr:hypothetical protein PRUPE_7G044400 [Prunus persica]
MTRKNSEKLKFRIFLFVGLIYQADFCVEWKLIENLKSLYILISECRVWFFCFFPFHGLIIWPCFYSLQLLGTGMDTQDTSPSVLLFFDKERFIFNAGEVRNSITYIYIWLVL